MKKLLLSGIAALLLATGTAHAGRYHDFTCSHGVVLHTAQNQYHDANGQRDVSKDRYDIQIENLRNPNNVRIRTDKYGFPFVNGKPCTLGETP
jgi:hypothetical protein